MSTAALDIFYPIVPDVTWLERLVPLGVRTVQLRLKDATDSEIERQVRESLAICAQNDCQLIVNDHWQSAIALGADYIHLGQEDIADADVPTIKAAGLKLGISTHNQEELDIALAVDPDYIALGPIYETILKKMKWSPQGLDRLADWKARISCPLCAIGGLTIDRAPGVAKAGADNLAVVTDFMTHANPEQRITEWLAWAEGARASAAK